VHIPVFKVATGKTETEVDTPTRPCRCSRHHFEVPQTQYSIDWQLPELCSAWKCT